MKRLATVALAASLAVSALAQKAPGVKSQKEAEAVQAVFNAQDPNARIGAVEGLLQKFHDTEFKGIALYLATEAAAQLNDADKVILYGERTLEADPKNYMAMLTMGRTLAARVREHDFDKEEKLGRAEKLAKDANETLKTATKLNPQMADADWENAKKDFTAQHFEVLGLAANARKKYDVSITNFKSAIELSSDPATMVRLAQAYNLAGKPDDAIAMADKVMAIADVNPQIKQFAQAEKARAAQAKGKTAAPAAAPAAAAEQKKQ